VSWYCRLQRRSAQEGGWWHRLAEHDEEPLLSEAGKRVQGTVIVAAALLHRIRTCVKEGLEI